MTCRQCNGTGVIETGNNDLPCDCPAGDTAKFNVCVPGGGTRVMDGAEIRKMEKRERNIIDQTLGVPQKPAPEELLVVIAKQARRGLRMREEMIEIAGAELTFADGFDDAILGIGERCGQPPVVVYSRERCIGILTRQGMSHEDAEDHFEFNVAGAWVGDRTPMFLRIA